MFSIKSIKSYALLATSFAVLTQGWAAETKFDWKAIEDEAVHLLSRYIQIDTTNPPGNELKAALFLKSILDREGIDSRIIESAPGRASFYARLKGDGSKKPIVLMHHMDVVPADAELWQVRPFSGEVRNGEIWGRGTLDNKGAGIFQLLTLVALKRQNLSLSRDVILLGTADEEAGGSLGAGFLLENHFDLFKDVGVVFNEGGGIRVDDSGAGRLYSVRVTEKVPLWLRLTAKGAPGHPASPGSDQAVLRLIAALNRVSGYQSPIKVISEVQQFYRDSAATAPVQWREKYLDLRKALEDAQFAAEFTRDRSNNARVRNTISITGLKGSDKINVIPPVATAEIDVRLLPGEDPQAFVKEMAEVIADESIKIDVLLSRAAATARPSPEAMEAIAEFARKHDPAAQILSPLPGGFTDCHFFHVKGIPCLGFLPQRSTASSEGLVHGVDERMPVERLKSALRSMYEIISKLAVK
jgi:acetylornithine deacetylase/succinyl-diaminopimelate desuccinylase-like protein